MSTKVESKLVAWGVPVFSRGAYSLAIQDCQITFLGSGSLGSAYQVADVSANWVIKKIKRHYLHQFLQEVYGLIKVQKVVGVQRLAWVCLEEEDLILATQYAGKTLKQCLAKKLVSPAQALSVIRQVSVTLAQMHQVGVTHNDLKEDNICIQFLKDELKVTLIDLGNAGAPGMKMPPFKPQMSTHLSPELARDAVTSARTDMYSLGVVVYHLERVGIVSDQIKDWRRAARNMNANLRPDVKQLLLAFNTGEEVATLLSRRRDKRYKRSIKQ